MRAAAPECCKWGQRPQNIRDLKQTGAAAERRWSHSSLHSIKSHWCQGPRGGKWFYSALWKGIHLRHLNKTFFLTQQHHFLCRALIEQKTTVIRLCSDFSNLSIKRNNIDTNKTISNPCFIPKEKQWFTEKINDLIGCETQCFFPSWNSLKCHSLKTLIATSIKRWN